MIPSLSGFPLATALDTFLLCFPALFSIMNPIGATLTFGRVTADRTHAERLHLARRIGFYAFLMLLGSLFLGSYVLTFMGISLGALRIAGGLVVATRAWELLTAPDQQSDRKGQQAAVAEERPTEDIAFFPLTMPFTIGPGTISVAVTLGATRPGEGLRLVGFFLGAATAAAAMAAITWLVYRSADRVMDRLGVTGTRIATRMVAFLLLCVGVQILCNGVMDLLGPLMRRSIAH